MSSQPEISPDAGAQDTDESAMIAAGLHPALVPRDAEFGAEVTAYADGPGLNSSSDEDELQTGLRTSIVHIPNYDPGILVPGDLVWAKPYPTHPFWPAQIADPRRSNAALDRRRKPEEFLVYFFGSHDLCAPQ